jgi:hypothetical protein
MVKHIVVAVAAAVVGLATLGPVSAQTLDMANPPPAASTSADTPARGMSMGQVEQKYGAPSDKIAAVGKPPISRWVYPNFIVYFEYDHVVHAVTTPANAIGTPSK